MTFEKILQIGIITENVEKSVEEFKKFGFGTWTSMSFEPGIIPDMTVNGQPGDLRLKIAMYHIDNLEIELIEPVSDSVFMDWLKEHGPGIHHLAFKPKEGYDAFMEEYLAAGYTSLIDVMDGAKTGGFSYLDTVKQLGFYAEIHKGTPGAPEGSNPPQN